MALPDYQQYQQNRARRPVQSRSRVLPTSGGGGTYDGMDPVQDIDRRLHRLEGGNDVLKWAVGIVSSVLIGLGAVIVALQVFLFQDIGTLTAKVDALPDRINANLVQMNQALTSAITATRNVDQKPTVIIMPTTRELAAQPNTPPG